MTDENITLLADSIASKIKSEKIDSVNLDIAEKLIHAVQAKAREMGLSVVVAVFNTGARPVAVECMDDSFIASFDVAMNKAYTVVALKMSTIELKALSQPGGSLYGIQHTNEGKIVIFGGGDPLRYNSKIIGGLGVSGGTEDEDTALSAYGAECLEKIIDNLRR